MKLVSIRACMAASGLALGAQSAAADTVLATVHLPATHWAVTQGVEPLLNCIASETGGAFEYQLFPGGQIASSRATLDALEDNLAQIAYVVPSHLSSILPLNNVPILPNMGDSVAEMVETYRAVVENDTLIAQELADANLVPILINMFPPYQIGLRGEAIRDLAGFENQKILVGGGAQNAAVEAVSGTSVQMSSADAYIGMQQGVVDGYIMSFASVSAYSLHEVSGSISDNANFAASAGLVAMNKDYYDGLPQQTRDAMTACGAKVEADLARFEDELTEKLRTEYAQAGVEVYSFAPEVLAEINTRLDAASVAYLERIEALGHPALEAYREYRSFLSE